MAQETLRENKMGTMPENKLLLSMAVPMMISMLVQALYNIVDSIFVSRICEDALTAVSMAFPLQNIIISIAVGFGVGINALLSRALGQKNAERVNQVAVNGLLLALLVTQIVAFPSALIFGRLSAKYPSSQLIPVCIAAYTGIAVFAFFLTQQWQFWVLAVMVGMFQGGVQALSRSHFAKIIPAEKSGEYFGLFDICGKGASFLGTMIVSVGSQLTGSANVGVGSIAVLFVIGFVLFRVSCRTEHAKQV